MNHEPYITQQPFVSAYCRHKMHVCMNETCCLQCIFIHLSIAKFTYLLSVTSDFFKMIVILFQGFYGFSLISVKCSKCVWVERYKVYLNKNYKKKKRKKSLLIHMHLKSKLRLHALHLKFWE